MWRGIVPTLFGAVPKSWDTFNLIVWTMKSNQTNILVIAPYTKRFGLALFRGSELIHFSVRPYKIIKRPSSVNTFSSAATSVFLRGFGPTMIIMKALTIRQAKSENQKAFLHKVRQFAQGASIPFEEVDLEYVKAQVFDNKQSRHQVLFMKLALAFPELSKMVDFQNASQAEYYTPVLSAIAIGAMGLHRSATSANGAPVSLAPVS